jgi:hypothetical protein
MRISFNFLGRRRIDTSTQALPRVTIVQWTLGITTVIVAILTNEFTTYAALALITQICAGLSLLLVAFTALEALRSRVIGKSCLVASVFVFYWVDALALSLQATPFGISEGFPIRATQFSQILIQQAVIYVSVFQLLLLVGYSIRPKVERPIAFLASRIDALSFDRSILGIMLIVCAVLPLLMYYRFDLDKILAVLLASRSFSELDAPEPGMAQHLTIFGIFGAALFFVYALKSNAWRRFWWLILGAIAAVPFISAGTRHIWLYISLPSVLIIMRGFKNRSDRKYGAIWLSSSVLIVLAVAQIQFGYRGVGWREIGSAPSGELSQVNTNGHFSALLFAEHLVPNEHAYFMEPVEFYFLIHWIPRQIWPNKPVMEAWSYYDDSYVQGAAYNVTPSVIGQFHMEWGLAGVIFIGAWLGFLSVMGDRLLLLLDANRQRAMFVVVGMFYAFIVSSFRFYSPVYFSYFLFGLIPMFLLTRRGSAPTGLALRTDTGRRLAFRGVQ